MNIWFKIVVLFICFIIIKLNCYDNDKNIPNLSELKEINTVNNNTDKNKELLHKPNYIVFGKNGLDLVERSYFNEYPWVQAIGGFNFHCTASLISPRLAITADHCINYSSTLSDNAFDIGDFISFNKGICEDGTVSFLDADKKEPVCNEIFPGFRGREFEYEIVQILHFNKVEDNACDYNGEPDIAVLVLDRNITTRLFPGQAHGFFPLSNFKIGDGCCSDDMPKLKVTIFGYPIDYKGDGPYTNYYPQSKTSRSYRAILVKNDDDDCEINDVWNEWDIETRCDVGGGMSGGPIFFRNDGQNGFYPRIIGINSCYFYDPSDARWELTHTDVNWIASKTGKISNKIDINWPVDNIPDTIELDIRYAKGMGNAHSFARYESTGDEIALYSNPFDYNNSSNMRIKLPNPPLLYNDNTKINYKNIKLFSGYFERIDRQHAVEDIILRNNTNNSWYLLENRNRYYKSTNLVFEYFLSEKNNLLLSGSKSGSKTTKNNDKLCDNNSDCFVFHYNDDGFSDIGSYNKTNGEFYVYKHKNLNYTPAQKLGDTMSNLFTCSVFTDGCSTFSGSDLEPKDAPEVQLYFKTTGDCRVAVGNFIPDNSGNVDVDEIIKICASNAGNGNLSLSLTIKESETASWRPITLKSKDTPISSELKEPYLINAPNMQSMSLVTADIFGDGDDDIFLIIYSKGIDNMGVWGSCDGCQPLTVIPILNNYRNSQNMFIMHKPYKLTTYQDKTLTIYGPPNCIRYFDLRYKSSSENNNFSANNNSELTKEKMFCSIDYSLGDNTSKNIINHNIRAYDFLLYKNEVFDAFYKEVLRTEHINLHETEPEVTSIITSGKYVERIMEDPFGLEP